MICENIKRIKRYCSNYEQIENYQEAISSPEKWDCHHRLEETGLSKKDLINKGMYYNRPASELIFLTHKEHTKIHKMGNIYWLGRKHSEESRRKMSIVDKTYMIGNKYREGTHLSDDHKRKISESLQKFICPIKLSYMYCKLEMSAYKISKEFGVGVNTILNRLKFLNIPIRKR